jgi:hypothetical protein
MYRFKSCLGFMVVLGWMSSCVINGRGNEYIHTYICSVHYGTRCKCPSFCCNNFLYLLNCVLILVFIFNSLVQSIPVWAITWQARQCICLHHIQSQVLGLLRAELCSSTFSGMATRGSLTDGDITELVENQTLTHIHWKTIFLLRVTVILSMQTVGLLYL